MCIFCYSDAQTDNNLLCERICIREESIKLDRLYSKDGLIKFDNVRRKCRGDASTFGWLMDFACEF